MPPKLIVPKALEKSGSCTQRLKMEPLLEREVTASSFGSNIKTPSAALIATPALFILTEMLKLLPLLYVPELGAKKREAARAKEKENKNKSKETAGMTQCLLNFIFNPSKVKKIISYRLRRQ